MGIIEWLIADFAVLRSIKGIIIVGLFASGLWKYGTPQNPWFRLGRWSKKYF